MFFNSVSLGIDALNLLQQFDGIRFKDAVVADNPTIQNILLEIGTVVTTVECSERMLSVNVVEKNIIEYHKMKNTPKIKKKKFKLLQELPENHELLQQFFSRNPIYENKLKLPVQIKDLDSLKNAPDNCNVFFTSDFMMGNINEEFNMLLPLTSDHSIEALSNQIMEALYIEEKRLVNCKKFKEIDLFINNLSDSVRVVETFKNKVMEYNVTEGCKFNRIYITDEWEAGKVHEIILNN